MAYKPTGWKWECGMRKCGAWHFYRKSASRGHGTAKKKGFVPDFRLEEQVHIGTICGGR